MSDFLMLCTRLLYIINYLKYTSSFGVVLHKDIMKTSQSS